MINIIELDYDAGDKRSEGGLFVKANTSRGELVINTGIGSSGEITNFEATLDDKPIDNDDVIDAFDPGLAHYYSGAKAVERCDDNIDNYVIEAIESMFAVLDEIEEEMKELARENV